MFLRWFLNGGKGSVKLAQKVLETLQTKKANYKPLYDVNLSIKEKIEIISKEIYHAKGVIFEEKALENIKEIENLGRDKLPVCMAKTPMSFSDNPNLLNVPKDFNITVKEVKISNGAGFIVVLCGNILTMPGLPKIPQAVLM